MRVTSLLSKTRAQLGHRDSIYIGVWLTVGVATEIAGRGSTNSDALDMYGVVTWAALISVTLLDHAREPLTLVRKLIGRSRRLMNRLPFRPHSVGLDLRRKPPLELGLPRSTEAALWSALAGFVVAWSLRDLFPVRMREAVLGLSPTLWFWLLGTIWAATIVSCVVLIRATLAVLRDRAPRVQSLGRRVPALTLFALLLLASMSIPAGVAVSIGLACAAAVVVVSASRLNPRMTLVFAEHEGGAAPCVLEWTQFLATRTLIATLTSGVLVTLMLGNPWKSAPLATNMPITQGMGRFLAWVLAAASLAVACQVLGELAQARREDPGGEDCPTLFDPGVEASDVSLCRDELESAGFRVEVDEGRAEPTHVRVTWNSGKGGERSGPFPMSAGQRIKPDTRRALQKRHRVLCRRGLRRGLREIFEAARHTSEDTGAGYWLAPHLWFFEGLRRDGDEVTGEFCKPHFRDALPRGARRHFNHVLAVLEIDLIFVEDGVRFEDLERVLAVMFILFDSSDGAGRAEERSFSGIPRVRVVLHDHDFETRIRSGTHPKPDYRALGRARILHVFLDRGGEDEPVLDPDVADHVPDVLPLLL